MAAERVRRYSTSSRRRGSSATLPDGVPTIATVKERVGIFAFIEHVGGARVGRAREGWTPCRCPFHDDKHASAQANPTTGYFVCFACEARGDVVALAQLHTGIRDVKEALRWLAANFRM